MDVNDTPIAGFLLKDHGGAGHKLAIVMCAAIGTRI
jgi:hypothetical protein